MKTQNKKIVISGTGCALADFLYNNISFDTENFLKYLSKIVGDGGLAPGKLVFREELEEYSGCDFNSILKEITGNKNPDGFNVGGPSLVSLIHASQLLDRKDFEVKYFGLVGKDKIAGKIFDIIRKTPLNIENYLTDNDSISPFTDVFSDPSYNNGSGERTFVNSIGAAWKYFPSQLSSEFYDSQIVCFGGTALIPNIHDNLTLILAKSKKNNCITIVNTVYDFRNEKRNPKKPWQLVDSVKSFDLIDVLILNCEEALKISGRKSIEKAADFFVSVNVSSFIITNGANNIFAWSGGRIFASSPIIQLPVSKKVTDDLKANPKLKCDTTGCGDNFAGGIIFSIARQLKEKSMGQFELIEAISWGIASGGQTCYTIGGTYLEKQPGEKLEKVKFLQKEYIKQIGY